MARLNNKTLLGVFISFLIVLALIAVIRAVFPAALYDGFSNMSCYGVKCNEGEFCQEGVCRPINPAYTNDYYNKGVEGFAGGFTNSWTFIGLMIGVPMLVGVLLLAYMFFPRSTAAPRLNVRAPIV